MVLCADSFDQDAIDHKTTIIDDTTPGLKIITERTGKTFQFHSGLFVVARPVLPLLVVSQRSVPLDDVLDDPKENSTGQ